MAASNNNTQTLSTNTPTCPRCHRHDQVSGIADLLPDEDGLSFTNLNVNNRSGFNNPGSAAAGHNFNLDCYAAVVELHSFHRAYFNNSLGVLASLGRRAAASRLDGASATAGLAALADGHIGQKTAFCFFKLSNGSTVYICNHKHLEASSEMTVSNEAQVLPKEKPTCPQCFCNDHVKRYYDIIRDILVRRMSCTVAPGSYSIYNNDPDASFLRRLRHDARDAFGEDDGTRLLNFDRTSTYNDDGDDNSIGEQTSFCLFQVPSDKAVYVCAQTH